MSGAAVALTDEPRWLSDPIGVLADLVESTEPTLERAVIEAVVASVAGGRAKRRRLAHALVDNPAVLHDGRSPAPRALGTLLIELRRAGATAISAPLCAACGKKLRSLQRRGEEWFCGVCGPLREPCSACGKNRPVAVRERDGRPRCEACSAEPGRDPCEIVAQVVAAIDPTVRPHVVVGAMGRAATKRHQQHRLAWAIEDRPELLTGEGASAPIPSVLRLIDELLEAGVAGVVRPACPHCGRVITLSKSRDGVRLRPPAVMLRMHL